MTVLMCCRSGGQPVAMISKRKQTKGGLTINTQCRLFTPLREKIKNTEGKGEDAGNH